MQLCLWQALRARREGGSGPTAAKLWQGSQWGRVSGRMNERLGRWLSRSWTRPDTDIWGAGISVPACLPCSSFNLTSSCIWLRKVVLWKTRRQREENRSWRTTGGGRKALRFSVSDGWVLKVVFLWCSFFGERPSSDVFVSTNKLFFFFVKSI